jgi:MoxR-like ATPase
MYFKIPELGHREVAAAAELRPIVVMTSNSEKNLAEAFLRRCIFYNIPFPSEERLQTIVHRRLGEQFLSGQHLDDALALFHRLRDRASGLGKKPSTGELLDWLQVLEKWLPSTNGGGLRDERLVEPTLSALVKTIDDRDQARKLVDKWISDD